MIRGCPTVRDSRAQRAQNASATMRFIAFHAKVALPQRLNPPPRTRVRNRCPTCPDPCTIDYSVIVSLSPSLVSGGVYMRRVALLIGLMGVAFAMAFAQTGGQITGEARDPAGALGSNASVTATNSATGVARTTTTNTSGIYSFPDLTPGTYDVKVVLSGFDTVVKTNIELQDRDRGGAYDDNQYLGNLQFSRSDAWNVRCEGGAVRLRYGGENEHRAPGAADGARRFRADRRTIHADHRGVCQRGVADHRKRDGRHRDRGTANHGPAVERPQLLQPGRLEP